MYKFPIIVFEGIEGSGKSFHINNVQKYFVKKKIKFIKFREPGGSKNSEKIRNFILNNNYNYKSLTDLFMYMAARNENYHNIIKRYYKIVFLHFVIYMIYIYLSASFKIFQLPYDLRAEYTGILQSHFNYFYFTCTVI